MPITKLFQPKNKNSHTLKQPSVDLIVKFLKNPWPSRGFNSIEAYFNSRTGSFTEQLKENNELKTLYMGSHLVSQPNLRRMPLYVLSAKLEDLKQRTEANDQLLKKAQSLYNALGHKAWQAYLKSQAKGTVKLETTLMALAKNASPNEIQEFTKLAKNAKNLNQFIQQAQKQPPNALWENFLIAPQLAREIAKLDSKIQPLEKKIAWLDKKPNSFAIRLGISLSKAQKTSKALIKNPLTRGITIKILLNNPSIAKTRGKNLHTEKQELINHPLLACKPSVWFSPVKERLLTPIEWYKHKQWSHIPLASETPHTATTKACTFSNISAKLHSLARTSSNQARQALAATDLAPESISSKSTPPVQPQQSALSTAIANSQIAAPKSKVHSLFSHLLYRGKSPSSSSTSTAHPKSEEPIQPASTLDYLNLQFR